MKTYISKKNDTFKSIARQFYQNPDEYLIIQKANPSIDPDNIPTGIVIIIPDSNIDTIKEAKTIVSIPNLPIDSLFVTINGVPIPIAEDFELEIFFDTCADRYQFRAPFNHINPLDLQLFKPYAFQEVKIFFGATQKFTGIQENPSFTSTPNTRNVVSAGRSKTYILVKSQMPVSAYPLERNNETLEQILLGWILPLFGLNLVTETSSGAAFERVVINESSTIWAFLQAHAVQRGVIFSNNELGNLVIKKSTLNAPVAKFINGVNLTGLNVSYLSGTRYNTYTALAQSPENGQLEATSQDKNFLEQSYKIFTAKDSTAGNIQKAADWEKTKAIRDSLIISPITMPGWINVQNNQIWEAGQVIQVQSPQNYLFEPINLMINSILFKKAGTVKSSELRVIPVSSYSGKPFSYIF